MLALDERRSTIPTDLRASLEQAYVLTGPPAFAPPPPRPSTKFVALWLVFAAVIASLYMSAATGVERQRAQSADRKNQ